MIKKTFIITCILLTLLFMSSCSLSPFYDNPHNDPYKGYTKIETKNVKDKLAPIMYDRSYNADPKFNGTKHNDVSIEYSFASTDQYFVQYAVPYFPDNTYSRTNNDLKKYVSDLKDSIYSVLLRSDNSESRCRIGIDCEVYQYNKSIASFKFDIYTAINDSADKHMTYSKTYDLNKNTEITFDALFKNANYMNTLSKSLKTVSHNGDLVTLDSMTVFNRDIIVAFYLSDTDLFMAYTSENSEIKTATTPLKDIKGLLNTKLLNGTGSNTGNSGNDTPTTNGKKVVALTFDDGPHQTNTPIVLDALKKHNAHATFFMLGNRLSSCPSVAKRMINEGHEIADHSWDHKDLTKLPENEALSNVTKSQKAFKTITGVEPKLVRPPYGAYNKTILKSVNMPFILWSLDTEDWKYLDTQRLIKYVVDNTRNGDIVLMHDIHISTANAVDDILTGLEAKGFSFVTVSELLGFDKNPTAVSAMAYSSGRK